MSIGASLAILVAPVLLLHRRPSKWEVWFFGSWVLACAGMWVTQQVALEGDSLRRLEIPLAISQSLMLLNFGIVAGVLLWAMRLVGLRPVALVYAGTILLTSASQGATWANNPWKYYFAWSVVTVLLALSVGASRAVQAIIALTCAAISIGAESRNSAGVLVIVALLVLISRPARPNMTRLPRRTIRLAVVGLGAVAAYLFAVDLIAQGTLGAALQERQSAQSTQGGGVLGGRVEFGAFLSLFPGLPTGFGPGVIPSAADIQQGKLGLTWLGAGPSSTYVDTHMFGSTVELHSIATDFWVIAGLPGLLLAGVCAFLLVALAVATATNATGRYSSLTAFLAIQCLWDLAFSPFYANGQWLALGVAAALFSIVDGLTQRTHQRQQFS